MSKLAHPKEIVRITLADEIPPVPGIYILAYLGRVVYVGKSESDVQHRLNSHKMNALESNELLGKWMIRCSDWDNVRLDILIPPDHADMSWWLRTAESNCIRRLMPLLNQQLQMSYAEVNNDQRA